MIQVLEHKVGNSHRQAFQCDPVLIGYLHLRSESLRGSGEWFGYFQDGGFRSAEKYIHFSE